IHIGLLQAGWLGLIIAGISFILPAFCITSIFAFMYVKYGSLPAIAPLFYGIKPVVLGIIVNAVWRLGKKAVKNRKLLLISITVALLNVKGLNEVIAMLIGGLMGIFWLRNNPPKEQNKSHILLPLILAQTINPVTSVSLWQLGLFFLKVGSVLFGGGYLLIAFLQGELVDQYHWLTQQQLLDSIAIGQFTPGPISSTATFIGYIIAGFPGAIIATIGIFLPSFIFVALLNKLIKFLRNSHIASAFLDAVNVSAIALMTVTIFNLSKTTITPNFPQIDIIAGIIAIASSFCAIVLQINSIWLILAGAIIGYIKYMILLLIIF
ncbi:MAG TPA: chromate efflux transporter, partial [Allocoleopsis sp.]